MYILALATAVGLPAFDLLTGEKLNVLLAGLVPAVEALAMGLLIRYVKKQELMSVRA